MPVNKSFLRYFSQALWEEPTNPTPKWAAFFSQEEVEPLVLRVKSILDSYGKDGKNYSCGKGRRRVWVADLALDKDKAIRNTFFFTLVA